MTAHSISSSISTSMWFFGMQPEEVRRIRDAAGAGYDCRLLGNLSSHAILSLLEGDDEPLLIWLGGKMWLRLREENPELLRNLLLAPTVLALEVGSSPEVLELALSAHVQQVIRVPLVDEQIFDALSRAREARNIYDDMARMSREIHIGRELMERKSSVCSLLFRFFEQVGSATNARDVFAGCAASLVSLPLAGVHGVWWGEHGPAYAVVGADTPNQVGPWFAFLVEQTVKWRSAPAMTGQPILSPVNANQANASQNGGHNDAESLRSEIRCLCAGGTVSSPDSGQLLLLTLEVSDHVCGMLVLHLHESCLCGRDSALALNAMRRHLALVMWEGSQREGFFRGAERLGLSSAQSSAVHSAGKGKAKAM